MFLGLLQSTHTQNMKSISQSSTNLWANIGFRHILQSVGYLESDIDQKLISSSPAMKDSTCKTKLKYLHRFLKYFGNRWTGKQTDRQTNRQTQANTLTPARKVGDKYWF